MSDIQIKLSIIWVVVLLLYIYGDILRMMSGDSLPGKVKIDGKKISKKMWLGISVMMLVPILMIFLSLVLPQPVNRWANMILAVFWFILNLGGLPTYPSAYDRFLLAVSMIFNLLTIWYAWGWS